MKPIDMHQNHLRQSRSRASIANSKHRIHLIIGSGEYSSEMELGHRVTGHRVSNLGPGRVGSRVKALTRLFDPDS